MTNPLFVRGHDFLGMAGANHSWRTTEMYGTGWPSNAGGRLVGSLSGLALCAGGSGTEFPGSDADAGADLGRSGAADDADGAGVPLLDRDAGPDALGGDAYAACGGTDGRSRGGAGGSATKSRRAVYRVANPSRAALVMRLIAAGDVRGAIESLTPSEMYAIADGAAPNEGTRTAARRLAEIAHLRVAGARTR